MQALGTRHKALGKTMQGNTNAFSANGAVPYQPGATPQESESESPSLTRPTSTDAAFSFVPSAV